MRRTRVIAVLLIALSLARPARAQDLLTLAQAVRDSLANNPALARARAAVAGADADRRDARARYFPQLSFSESWQRSDQPVFAFGALLSARQFTAADFAVNRLNDPGATNLFTGRIGVHQLIFDGGGSRAGLAAANRQRDAAQAGLAAARADLAVAVTRAYGRVLSAEAGRRAAATAVTAAQEDVHRAEQRREAGTATDADVLAMTVHVADVRQREIQAESDAAIARAELNRLMGAPIDRAYGTQEPSAPDPVPGDLAPLAAEAETASPELVRAIAERAAAEASARQARAGWFPTIALDAGYQTDGLAFSNRASSWMLSGAVRWTISTGGTEAARVAAADAAVTAARAAEADVRAAVRVGVFAALKQLEAARARLTTGLSAVDQARESQRVIRNRYEAGLAGITDVLRAAAAELDAEAQRIAALVDAIAARAELTRALGRDPQ